MHSHGLSTLMAIIEVAELMLAGITEMSLTTAILITTQTILGTTIDIVCKKKEFLR